MSDFDGVQESKKFYTDTPPKTEANSLLEETKIAMESYKAARNEILLRLKLRDQILLTYLIVIVTIFGTVLSGRADKEVLLAIPFLALAIISLITQHLIIADHLGKFCSNEKELEPYFKEVPQWDSSRSFKEYTGISSKIRMVTYSIVIIIPCIISLFTNSEHIKKSPLDYGQLLWALCLICSISAAIFMWYAYSRREKRYNERFPNNSK